MQPIATGEGLSVGAWEPRWLNADGQRLYAALHPARGRDPKLGLVFAPPMLHEQPRSRRMLTELAGMLAAMGVPCLRFDYFGTGDSAGAGEDLDFASMGRDLDQACDALRYAFGVDSIAVLAVRGAALPAFQWVHRGGDARLLVLWEPVIDGAEWLKELEERDRAERRSPKRYPLTRGGAAQRDGQDDRQLMGYPASEQLRHDIARARVFDDGSRPLPRCWAVLRSEDTVLPLSLERGFVLPENTPLIGGEVAMDASMFMTAELQRVTDGLGKALLEEG